MIAVVALLAFVSIALPLAFAWRLWRLDEPTRLGWLLVLAETAVFVALIMILARWDIAGLWSRLALSGLVGIAGIASAWRHASRPWRLDGLSLWPSYGSRLAALALFGPALIYVVVGLLARHDPRDLTFPLTGGQFVVAQGGSAGILNHHHSHRAQRHALDITAVGPLGFRASGLLPDDPSLYAVFGKSVISPCDGMVKAAVDGLPDLSPPARDKANPAGNHVVLSCGDLEVELAHLRMGSVVVEAGRQIRTRDPIGQVGNSGTSTEPHLHIHAVDAASGMGIQMSFEGVIPARNTQFSE
ncbi:M23 family metallopeptidase [Taklimakanibacter albus]|uniref:M23 family metallopeptidase n=1 Tax=Taklimakanibacter albus TaxID=2800327 RepID=A0ACC5R1D8_9HYPH|nr:M23 family metallopeptidase [Aestuariivirga sp. YIM B02566]MBK1866471.1 M23 family metallopeptidase [Aestuariivirga sp. YIM B02566]